jgi:hypothetical protein
MPTTLQRTLVTHTPIVEHALKVASSKWPGSTPRVLMQNMFEYASQAIEDEGVERLNRIRAIADEISAEYGEGYSADYLDEVRQGW